MYPQSRYLKFTLDFVFVSLFFLWSCSVFAQEQLRGNPSSITVEVEESVNLHIVDWGGEGPPLLFVPSWAATSHVFDDFAPRFTDTHRVLVMNKRGHGESSRPGHGYTIDRLTKDILDVLNNLGIQRATLVGLSRSASLTTQFAAKYPERVSSLIYLSGPYDREYARSFEAQSGISKLRYQQGAYEITLRRLCSITEDDEPLYPAGSFDDAADELGVEWRNSDPAPPYTLIKAPAIAFWRPTLERENRFRSACEGVDNETRALELIGWYSEDSARFYERAEHDIELFRQDMEFGTVIQIPEADYYTYLSHPVLVEAEIRSFLSSN